ncbi:MAG: ATP-binding cassette domain-containing protein, partial [Candidatus Omnitrophota bacterium]
ILRFSDPSQGAILIDGTDIRDVTQNSLRDNICFVPQDPKLFNRTIKENIRYGRFSATDDEVMAAAKAAQVHGFIQSLSKGYDTYVGEHGDVLSGGQKQRIMLARALAVNPNILLPPEHLMYLRPVISVWQCVNLY